MIILASNSERRQKLLQDAGISFKVYPSDIVEDFDKKLKPQEVVEYLSFIKAESVQKVFPEDIIIGADTIVVFKGEILGKPKSSEDAFRMLKMLSGETHDVLTGVTILKGEIKKTIVSESKVIMRKYSDLEIEEYIKTGEPMDKAGSYAIQGIGGQLVDSFEGDFFSIVGLPLKKVLDILKEIQ